ncbi:FAD-dependent oxidoreductase [Dietzia sp. UBA5065]|uniref:FAD-dependent oxidoreductase n=1 Tax=Dietzia sp. UBA5065 TaxID=1946422 RepID=UPI0025C5426B|nr:FAD-dependent oxidoreductase [Dietzia sp. UBA5065]
MKIVIVGGVAGGMSAATRLRRLSEDADITVVERSGYVSFANCGLPYHVGGVIEDRSALLLQTPQSLAARFGIRVLVGHEVTSVDRGGRVVQVTGPDGEASLDYDALVLSPGARPVRPPIPGIERALSLRDIEDTDAMVDAVSGDVGSVVVIGGGFIGIELAENLRHRGLDVTIVEAADQVMAPLDPEMAAFVHQRLRESGVVLHLGAGVSAIGERDVTLADGSTVPADIVVAAIGVRPDSTLATDAGLEVDERGGIVVDEAMRTSDPAIYAVGDAVVKRDAVDGSAVMVPLANTANRQGRMVADVIMGRAAADRPVLGTAIVGVFGLQVATTGWNAKRLAAAGRPFRQIHTHPASHAGYYPGAAGLHLKLLVDPETDAILGAQALGEDGADKRIDVIATAMAGGITASRLADLELAYAPAFGSAKDPVNMLGYVAGNLRDGTVKSLQWDEVADRVSAGDVLLDTRTPEEVAAGAIPGAVNIPVDDLRDRLGELPEGRVVAYCAVGVRGYLAARILTQSGREAVNLDGGYTTWRAATGA